MTVNAESMLRSDNIQLRAKLADITTVSNTQRDLLAVMNTIIHVVAWRNGGRLEVTKEEADAYEQEGLIPNFDIRRDGFVVTVKSESADPALDDDASLPSPDTTA